MDELRETRGPERLEFDSLVRSVRRLTIAVWTLVALLVAMIVLPRVSFYLANRGSAPAPEASSGPTFQPTSAPYSAFDVSEFNSFHAFSPEEKIRRATVIPLTEIQGAGEQRKEVISEIVKRAPGVNFYYEVGDQLEPFSRMPLSGCDGCGRDGQVVFLLGNPAQMVSSTSYEGGRIDGMGGLSLERLRELAQQSAAEGGPAGTPPVRQR